MNPLFIPFLLSHLIADFPLQTDRVFQWKRQGLFGVGIHSSIFVLVALSFCIPLLGQISIWRYIPILGLSHFLIDWLKIFYHKKSKRDDLWSFLFDQLFHTISILLISLIASRTLEIPPIYQDIQRPLIYLCGLTTATFSTSILIPYLRYTIIPDNRKEIKTKDNLYELLERFLVFALIILPGHFYLFLPVILFLRRNFLKRKAQLTLFNLLAEPLISSITGLIIRCLVSL